MDWNENIRTKAAWRKDLQGKRLLTAGQAFAERLQQVRAKQGLSQQELSDRLGELGYPLHRVVIGKLEQGETRARNVTLEEVLAIALALGIPPVELMVPYDGESRLAVVGDRRPVVADVARYWIAGRWPLYDEDPETYYLELPDEKLVGIAKEAREVAIGEGTTERAFLLRQRLVREGSAPPIIKEEEA